MFKGQKWQVEAVSVWSSLKRDWKQGWKAVQYPRSGDYRNETKETFPTQDFAQKIADRLNAGIEAENISVVSAAF
jgi:hypothetical protein